MKLVIASLIGLTALASAAPADAQWRGDRGRRTVVIEQQSGINPSTLAAILAIQLARRAAEEKRTTVIQDRSREYVPLK